MMDNHIKAFIESLSAIDAICNPTEANMSYMRQLAVNYGLPVDDQAIAMVEEVIAKAETQENNIIPDILANYIKIVLWDIGSKTSKPLTALITAFLIGKAFGEIIDIS